LFIFTLITRNWAHGGKDSKDSPIPSKLKVNKSREKELLSREVKKRRKIETTSEVTFLP
jgi:hypothetical protein